MVWGALRGSAFFDEARARDQRIFAGVTLGYGPSFLPGLSLGAIRVRYQVWAGALRVSDLFGVFGEAFNPGHAGPNGTWINDDADQMASVVARWVLPQAGFEAYAELARGDFAADLREFLIEPTNTSGLIVGFQKSILAGRARWRIVGESTRLSRSVRTEVREPHIFYAHGVVEQGYTHRGQLLGAGIGPGSNAQFLGVDRYSGTGKWGVFVERVNYDDDAFLERFFMRGLGYLHQQVEWTVGGSMLRFVGPANLGMSLELNYYMNRYFVRDSDVTNLKATVTARLR
jgi:hypothetical protein